ncbi:BON domain-containing protein [Flavobacterium sp. TMP13]|uniref:BON domain-containing protein n=1 Tax=unclassified Flavobacterium TaxID=196869 RepID=UPI00076CC4B0|nr:BON domain-containing protein [Flavobacterium sp. TAB 87]KVV14807.1 putative periplasmic or secreted lipoprotein [Flavobacterium sp. TAB 87]
MVPNIEGCFESIDKKNDTEIAAEIRHAFKWHWDIPDENIKLHAKNGCLIVTSEIEWNKQKQAAKLTVSNFLGVKEIANNITILQKLKKAACTIKNIERALWRNVTIDHNDITITVAPANKITLIDMFDSLHQKEEPTRIAWSTPGVLKVDNQLTVDTDIVSSK